MKSAKRSRAARKAARTKGAAEMRRAGYKALSHFPSGTVSRRALSRQAREAASERSPAERSRAARRAIRTKGPRGLREAGRKAARTRERSGS